MLPPSGELKKTVFDDLPREFLLRVAEEMDAAYAAAKREADNTLPERPLYSRRLGQTRHFEREEALMRAAQATGLPCRDARPHNYPKVIVETDHLRLAELKVDHWGDLPLDSEERRSLAASNPIVGTYSGQLNVFADPVVAERMLAYVVVANPVGKDAELPGAVGIGIPTANLDDWALLMKLEEILALDNADVGGSTPIVDRVQPRLRLIKKSEDKAD